MKEAGKKTALIINYHFPPFPDIGGRRWAKFAKWMSRKGVDVHVIAAENPFAKQSAWIKDIAGLEVRYLPLRYPRIVMEQPKSLVEKIAYRVQLMLLKLQVKGDYYDRSVFWKSQLLGECEKLITSHGIKNVIVSGAPFRLTYFATLLKRKFPGLNLIVDFRDLWVADTSNSALPLMVAERKNHEALLEKQTVRAADKVITVAEKMCRYFSEVAGDNKCHVIPNGYDEDDIVSAEEIRSKDYLELSFTGTLYPNLSPVFFPFVDALAQLKSKHSEIYGKMRISFYGSFPDEYIRYVKQKEVDVIVFHQPLPLQEVQQKIAGSDACLLFLNNTYGFSLSTKFCEYIANKKKVVVFSEKGEAATFITANNLGYAFEPSGTLDGLLKLYNEYQQGNLQKWDSTFDIESFSVRHLTDEVIKLLK